MSEPGSQAAHSAEEMHSALFAQLVMQQSNMAMMLLGKVAHPDTGKAIKDLDAARLFIDQLDMLETKTKGNLTKEESALLKQTLMSLRLNFVEAVEAPSSEPAQPEPTKSSEASASSAAQSTPAEESHKKFSKKY